MAWELVNCEAKECAMDDSKHYVVVNYCGSGMVRCDIMADQDIPVKSYKGYFKDVRKYVINFLAYAHVSLEHASYIGEELALADQQKEKYKQD